MGNDNSAYSKEEVSKRFKLDKGQLGDGSYAVVKQATRRSDGEQFAIKIIKKKVLNPAQMNNIREEVEVMLKLDHPSCVRLHEIYETEATLYLVLELVQGGELFNQICDGRKFTEREAAFIVRDIADGLAYLHSQRIVHRDLKPENILLTGHTGDGNMEVKLSDFGVAKYLKDPDSKMLSAAGSPSYVAPEILSQRAYGPKVDIWSLGVITYVMLCGFHPFTGNGNRAKLYEAIQSGYFDFPDPHWTRISSLAKCFIESCLQVDPKRRLTAREILAHPWLQPAVLRHRNLSQMAKATSPSDRLKQLQKGHRALQRAVAKARALSRFEAAALENDEYISGAEADAGSELWIESSTTVENADTAASPGSSGSSTPHQKLEHQNSLGKGTFQRLMAGSPHWARARSIDVGAESPKISPIPSRRASFTSSTSSSRTVSNTSTARSVSLNSTPNRHEQFNWVLPLPVKTPAKRAQSYSVGFAPSADDSSSPEPAKFLSVPARRVATRSMSQPASYNERQDNDEFVSKPQLVRGRSSSWNTREEPAADADERSKQGDSSPVTPVLETRYLPMHNPNEDLISLPGPVSAVHSASWTQPGVTVHRSSAPIPIPMPARRGSIPTKPGLDNEDDDTHIKFTWDEKETLPTTDSVWAMPSANRCNSHSGVPASCAEPLDAGMLKQSDFTQSRERRTSSACYSELFQKHAKQLQPPRRAAKKDQFNNGRGAPYGLFTVISGKDLLRMESDGHSIKPVFGSVNSDLSGLENDDMIRKHHGRAHENDDLIEEEE